MSQEVIKQMNAGEKKVEEYAKRLESGESEDTIMQGLPPVFSESIRRRREELRLEKLSAIRSELGIRQGDVSLENESISDLENYVKKLSDKSSNQAVKDLYKSMLEKKDTPEVRKDLAYSLFRAKYADYREADYPTEEDEEDIWEYARSSRKLPVNTKKEEWVYRGIFPSGEIETKTRGSFNVHVTKELIDKLDELILNGTIRANYKFGQPNTKAAPSERSDSISIYFLEEPNQDALDKISKIIQPYVRGNNLLGHKISDGFYMSEIGHIESKHIDGLLDNLQSIDPSLADAVKRYVTPRVDRGTKLQMSEAQYYAIHDICDYFGILLKYTKDTGFEVQKA